MARNRSGAAELWTLAWVFLKLGSIGFGGPAAHIALMEQEVVQRRRWLLRQQFLDLLGATQLIPGPNSTELAIHIGQRRAGWRGLLVAGCCFILPAALIVTAFAWAYVHFGTLPRAAGLLYGVKPVIIAVVLQALWGLGRGAVKSKFLALVGLAILALCLLRIHELALLLGAGLFAAWVHRLRRHGADVAVRILLPAPQIVGFLATAPGTVVFGLWPLFLFFLKVGSVLFGSGYVLLAFLRGDLVERWGWLTNAQLLDAVAVGQVTPGPVFTTATFIGYVLAGSTGALVATIGIFLPAFVFVACSGPLVPRLRRSPTAGAFLDGVNVASLALMTAVTYELGRSALVDSLTWGAALVSAVLLLRFRVNSAWLVCGGAVLGSLLHA